jgi:hypothetical protein
MRLNDIPDPDAVEEIKVEHNGIEVFITSTLSSVYNDYLSLANRKVARGLIDLDSPEGNGEVNREGAAYLVRRWNLEDELTREGVIELFRKVPDLLKKVQTEASIAAVSLGKSPENSNDSPKDITSSPKE